MGIYEGRGQLGKSMKALLNQWSEARGSWNDSVSKNFEEKFLVPMEQDLKDALAAMDHMAVILQQVKRDCQ